MTFQNNPGQKQCYPCACSCRSFCLWGRAPLPAHPSQLLLTHQWLPRDLGTTSSPVLPAMGAPRALGDPGPEATCEPGWDPASAMPHSVPWGLICDPAQGPHTRAKPPGRPGTTVGDDMGLLLPQGRQAPSPTVLGAGQTIRKQNSLGGDGDPVPVLVQVGRMQGATHAEATPGTPDARLQGVSTCTLAASSRATVPEALNRKPHTHCQASAPMVHSMVPEPLLATHWPWH